MTDCAEARTVLPSESAVWRLIRKKAWKDPDTGELLPDAYIRRLGVDNDGLSVGIAGACTLAEFAAQLKKVHGVASLQVGSVRDIGLDVLPDDPAQIEVEGGVYDPSHANIVGVPYVEDNPREAERLAGLLARQSRLINIPGTTENSKKSLL